LKHKSNETKTLCNDFVTSTSLNIHLGLVSKYFCHFSSSIIAHINRIWLSLKFQLPYPYKLQGSRDLMGLKKKYEPTLESPNLGKGWQRKIDEIDFHIGNFLSGLTFAPDNCNRLTSQLPAPDPPSKCFAQTFCHPSWAKIPNNHVAVY